MPTNPTLVDGVFQGGGALGAAYVGALRALEANGIWFSRVAGNSAGSIIAALVAAGFTAKEIEWLCAGVSAPSPVPQTLQNDGINNAIIFKKFLDFPNKNTIITRSKRKTVLWKALYGSVIDHIEARIEKQTLPVPTRGALVKATLDQVNASPILGPVFRAPGMENALRGILNTALGFLPTTPPTVGDLIDLNTASGPRDAIADQLWDAVASLLPIELVVTNLLYEGSLYEGNRFVADLSNVLNRRVNNNAAADVQFKDLKKIPLAVIAANIDTGAMEVYSSEKNPNMLVVDAVRRSMSIPLAFQPVEVRRGSRKFRLVDGGIASNFPLWLLTSAANNYWPRAVRNTDNGRPVVGFSLDDTADPKSEWHTGQARFQLRAGEKSVDTFTVLGPLLREQLDALTGVSLPADSTTAADFVKQLKSVELIDIVLRTGIFDKERSTRKQITAAIMDGKRYFDVEIPLRGYHWLDFDINADPRHKAALYSMWDRAWHATVGVLRLGPNPLIGPVTSPSPYQLPRRIDDTVRPTGFPA